MKQTSFRKLTQGQLVIVNLGWPPKHFDTMFKNCLNSFEATHIFETTASNLWYLNESIFPSYPKFRRYFGPGNIKASKNPTGYDLVFWEFRFTHTIKDTKINGAQNGAQIVLDQHSISMVQCECSLIYLNYIGLGIAGP